MLQNNGPEYFKKSRPKNCEIKKINFTNFFSREIAFLAVLNFFPVQKLIFGLFLKLQKIDFGQKNFFREIDLFDFTSFFWPGLF